MAKRTCGIKGCEDPHLAQGYCNKHWKRWRKYSDPLHVEGPYRGGARRYPINEAFFDEIATERQAYWLGFITADGGISDSPRGSALKVELSAVDAGHLARMCDDLGSTKPVKFRDTFVAVSFDSQHLTVALARLGITPRKSATVRPWAGPPDLMPHYWRGMFDGDGSIWQTTRDGVWGLGLSGSEACVKAFAGWGREVCGSRATPVHAKGGCWRWTVCGNRKAQLLAAALYGAATVSLARKQERADTLCAIDFEAAWAASELRRGAAIREAWASGRHPRARQPMR